MLSYRKLIKGKKHLACVVPHTHWDRAWYQPVEQFRLSLCRVTKRVLDLLEKDKSYRKFVFDGQTVVLEDFLELFPEERNRIQKLVKSGKLVVGPFYVLPDFLLVTGESIIRNGLIGGKIAESFGGKSKQGYVADPFGFPSQIPQIFSKLGIESMIFTRGMPLKDLERAGTIFKWCAPDGKSVITGVLQIHGYHNICSFGIAPTNSTRLRAPADTDNLDLEYTSKQIRDVLEKWKTYKNRSKVIFFGNGVDHYGPTARLAEVLEYNGKVLKDTGFVICDCDEMLDLIRQENARLAVVSGEFHEKPTLEGTLDTRPYLKQQYHECASMLEKYCEPLLALSGKLVPDTRFIHREVHMPAHAFSPDNNHIHPCPLGERALEYAWKTLLKNAPHDDMCGCSVDRTHRDAENRAERVMDITKLVATDSMLRLARNIIKPHGDIAAQILAWNPLGFGRRVLTRRTMTVPGISGRFKLLDHAGTEIPAHIRATHSGKEFKIWNGDAFFATGKKSWKVKLEFMAELPACGYAAFYLAEGQQGLKAESGVQVTKGGMENEFLRVGINSDGTFDLYDKPNRTLHRNLNRLKDIGDGGNEYASTLIENSTYIAERKSAEVELIENTPLRVTFKVTVTLKGVPAMLTEDRKQRAGVKKDLKVVFVYSLKSRSRALEIEAVTDNVHEDHRLTVEFPVASKTNSSFCQTTYDISERSGDFLQAFCRDFVCAGKGGSTISILSKAMYSYDQKSEKGRLTLSKCLLKASGVVMAELWKSPEGNSKRRITQNYAVAVGCSRERAVDISKAAADFTTPPYIEHFIEEDHLPRHLPGKASFIELGGSLELSAFKRSEGNDSLILRVVNFSTKAERCTITISPCLKVKQAFFTDLTEQRTKKAPFRDDKILLNALPMEITTIALV